MANQPLSGHWQGNLPNKNIFYGRDCVENHLISSLPSPVSKAIIITGATLANTTPLVRRLQDWLGDCHAGTISYIRQHGPESDVDRATAEVFDHDHDIDTIISLGGGSPIDSAKVICLRVFERRGTPIKHLCIPTTLSAAECTAGGGYTKPDGVKVGFRSPHMNIQGIFYDPYFASYTNRELWLSSGMRAMDHAVECMYHPSAAEVPWKVLALWAAGELYHGLIRAAWSESQSDSVTIKLMLAACASSAFKGERLIGGMGLSHSLGHALGSVYGIPHGITSCMTLAKVVRLKAQTPECAIQISRLLVPMGGHLSGNTLQDAAQVADRIESLTRSLGLRVGTLESWDVPKAELAVIVKRATGDGADQRVVGEVTTLVEGLFPAETNGVHIAN